MNYGVALKLEKLKLKEVTDFIVKLWGFCFFKEITQKLFQIIPIIGLPGKIINFLKSFSLQLYKIIIDYLFKVAKATSKQCSGAISASLFSQIKFFKVIHLLFNGFFICLLDLSFHQCSD